MEKEMELKVAENKSNEDFAANPVSEPSPEEFKGAVIKDIQEFVTTLRNKNLFSELRALQNPSPFRGILTVLTDWLMIFIAGWLTIYVSIYFLPLSILIIGNRQRALGNLLHDAGHLALDRVKRRNDLIANLALSWPLFNLTSRYWHQHRTHHLYLGSVEEDPDFIHENTFWKSTWKKVLMVNLFSWPMFKSNTFGQISDVAWKDLMKFILWWVVLLGLLALIAGPLQALTFFAIWMISRATIFHFITTFREISDHVGLLPGTLIGFTRNNPTKGIARFFYHPHDNGYHLTHHLAQRVPFYALPKAHKLFLNCAQYQIAHHCDGYFWGKHTVVDCWTGKCQQQVITN